MSSNIKILRTCAFCGNEFSAKTVRTRYCSHPCNQKHYKKLKREEKLQITMSGLKTSIPAEQGYGLEQKEFLNIKETATLLGTSRRTIQRLIVKRSLRVGKLGRRTIIKRSEIENLFK